MSAQSENPNPSNDVENVDGAALELQQLAQRIAQLIALAQNLDEENRRLKAEQQNLNLERQQLIERNSHARQRIEAMISRLRTLEASV
jgi:cell division protein ZapB